VILNAVLTAACNGDMTAARIVLFDLLPKIERPADAVAASAAILSAVADAV
jgi:hypothetical protein